MWTLWHIHEVPNGPRMSDMQLGNDYLVLTASILHDFPLMKFFLCFVVEEVVGHISHTPFTVLVSHV